MVGLEVDYKVYRRRWAILAIFVLFCVCNAVQWIQYSVIAHIFVQYYNVEYDAIDWTSLIYMLTFVAFILPATWLLNVKGLRLTVTLAMVGNCLGAWIKVLSVHPDRFWVTFIGQTIVAISQVYVMSTPAPVAATWFGPNQVATACAIGVLGLQLGNAVGFLVPPLIVKDSEVDSEIGESLYYMFGGQAILCTVVLALVVVFFKVEPPTPPSKVQAEKANLPVQSAMEFFKSVWRVARNLQFLILFCAYGISQGVFYAILTYLTQIILLRYDYEGADKDAGLIGVTLMLVGILGSVVCGYILDVTRKYKECCLALYLLSLVATIFFTLSVGPLSIAYVYVAAGILGFIMIGYLPVGYEFAAELTYPESEATSACVLALGSQIVSFLFTLLYGVLLDGPGDRVANWTMCGTLIVGLALSALNKPQYKRQAFGTQQKTEIIEQTKF